MGALLCPSRELDWRAASGLSVNTESHCESGASGQFAIALVCKVIFVQSHLTLCNSRTAAHLQRPICKDSLNRVITDQNHHCLMQFHTHAKVKVKSLSRVRLFATPWTVAHQAPLSMEFSRQEYWSGLPFPSPGDLRKPGIEPRSPALQADALPSEPPGKSPYAKGTCQTLDILTDEFLYRSRRLRDQHSAQHNLNMPAAA